MIMGDIVLLVNIVYYINILGKIICLKWGDRVFFIGKIGRNMKEIRD